MITELVAIAVFIFAAGYFVGRRCGRQPMQPIVRDTADVVEVNRYYDEDGKPVFTQLIFWQWSADDGAFHVFAWRMLKSPDQYPVFDLCRRCYVTQFVDQGTLRVVLCKSRRDTWTQWDPELFDRQFVPQSQRRGLSR